MNVLFDVKSEKFKIIALWNESHWLYSYNLLEVKGKLAYRVIMSLQGDGEN